MPRGSVSRGVTVRLCDEYKRVKIGGKDLRDYVSQRSEFIDVEASIIGRFVCFAS